jgi:hypothetical protein
MVLRSLKDGGYTSITEHKSAVEILTTMEQQRMAENANEWELLGDSGSFFVANVDGDSIKILKITEEKFTQFR